MEKRFRYLVLFSFVLYVLWFYFPYIDPLFFDEERLGAWELSGLDAKFEFPAWYNYLWMAFWAVVAFGLYQFNAWSRELLIIGYIIGYFLSPIHGTEIQSPLSASVSNLNTLIDGVILGMAYFSPVAERFNTRAT